VAAHVGRGWSPGGLATLQLLAGLDSRGHAVRVYCSDRDVKGRATARGILARRQELGSLLAVRRAVRFTTELRLRQPDVLVLTAGRTLRLGGWAAQRAAVPRLVAWIGLEGELPRGRGARVATRTYIHAAVFPTEDLKRGFLESFPEFAGDAVTIVPGVSTPVLRGGLSQRAMLGVPLGAPLIGAVGPLVTRKRFDRLAHVLAALPDAHGLVIGDGPARRAIEKEAERLGVSNRLHMPGRQEDVGPILDALDVFVVTADTEGFNHTMLQALAGGVPVVSTPAGGAREALAPADGGGAAPGVVVDPNAEAVAAELSAMLADRRRLREMGQAASRVARTRFAEARMLDAWEAVLKGFDARGTS
jgi:glycosyltransferase involved in cell wall biosynthesis